MQGLVDMDRLGSLQTDTKIQQTKINKFLEISRIFGPTRPGEISKNLDPTRPVDISSVGHLFCVKFIVIKFSQLMTHFCHRFAFKMAYYLSTRKPY